MIKLPHQMLENRSGTLYVDGVSSVELAQDCDTPVYVISERRVRENYVRLRRALSRHYPRQRIYYSAKANTNTSILRILYTEGAFLDTVSPGEVFLALKVGFPPERILFTGTNVRNEELRFLVDSKIPINIDSISQMKRLLGFNVPDFLSIRVNPEVGAGHHEHVITAGENSKFGIWEEDIMDAYRYAMKSGVKRFGIHMHIGSGILSIEPFILALEKLLRIASLIHEKLAIEFEFINMGGGIGVPYKPEDNALDLNLLAHRVLQVYKKRIEEFDLGRPLFCIEPGRFIVCDAGVLLTKVNTVKVTPRRKFVGVDAGFNTLIRPALYSSYHPIVVVNRLDEPDEETYDVAGPICESGDLLARERSFPRIQEGDILAILNAGAYGFSMSSTYNSRPRCSEVLVRNGEYAQIREREDFENLFWGQRYPNWLE